MTHQYKPGPAKLRNGWQAKIYEVLPDGRIMGAYRRPDLGWIVADWFENGRYFNRSESELDLVLPEPERPRGWVNVYRRDDGTVLCGGISSTESLADIAADRREKDR